MSDAAFGKALRDIKFAERVFPQKRLRQLDALRRTVDDTGALTPESVAPYRTPLVMNWFLTTFEWQRVARGGKLSLISAYASVAPSTADTVITLYATSEFDPSSTTAVTTVRIPVGQRFGSASPLVDIGTGTWLNPSLTTSGSASLISVSLNITQGE